MKAGREAESLGFDDLRGMATERCADFQQCGHREWRRQATRASPPLPSSTVALRMSVSQFSIWLTQNIDYGRGLRRQPNARRRGENAVAKRRKSQVEQPIGTLNKGLGSFSEATPAAEMV